MGAAGNGGPFINSAARHGLDATHHLAHFPPGLPRHHLVGRERILALADRLMQRKGHAKASERRWLIAPDDPRRAKRP
jgi:hypothetical protein